MNEHVLGGILGLAVGDALGTPVEFDPRSTLDDNPVDGMRAYGTYEQPAGAWSDDTSLTLCLMISMTQKQGIDYNDVMEKFKEWFEKGHYSSTGSCFDIGHATRKAILLNISGHAPQLCGGISEAANGNGSLMRISPLAFYFHPLRDHNEEEYMDIIHNISALTHAHPISKMACGIYVHILDALLRGASVEAGLSAAHRYYSSHDDFQPWIHEFQRVFNLSQLENAQRTNISSDTYVVHTLEAALWAFVTTKDYSSCVLTAVNLGLDADTVAAVAGSLAGIKYGAAAIPTEWTDQLLQKDFLMQTIEFFSEFVK